MDRSRCTWETPGSAALWAVPSTPRRRDHLPCHRVVGRDGHLSDAFQPLGRDSHRMLLEMEGVPFRLDGTVDLEKCLWRGPDDS